MAIGFRPPFLEEETYDNAIAVPEALARQNVRRIAHGDGLFAGTSTGMNVAAGVEVASE